MHGLQPTKKSRFDIKHVEVDPLAHIPPFSFTKGLSDHELPELIVFALNPDVAEELLGRVIGQILDDTLVLVDGVTIERAATVELKARKLDENLCNIFVGSHFNRFNHHEIPTRFFQIVLPDQNGLFPSDVGCDAIMKYTQTIELIVGGSSNVLSARLGKESRIKF